MSSDTETFIQAANAFCLLIEQKNEDLNLFLTDIRKVLSELYLAALALPDIECDAVEYGQDISHEQWSDTFSSLQSSLGKNDIYWIVYDPIAENPEEPIAGSLADDLADIWRDLKKGLLAWPDESEHVHNAIIWDWQFKFRTHWSMHAMDALRVLNWRVTQSEFESIY